MKELVKKMCEQKLEIADRAVGNGLPINDDIKIIQAFANQCFGAIELAITHYNLTNEGANADSAKLLQYHADLNARFEKLLERIII